MKLDVYVHSLVKQHGGKLVNVSKATGLNEATLSRLRSGKVVNAPQKKILDKLGLEVDYVVKKDKQS